MKARRAHQKKWNRFFSEAFNAESSEDASVNDNGTGFRDHSKTRKGLYLSGVVASRCSVQKNPGLSGSLHPYKLAWLLQIREGQDI